MSEGFFSLRTAPRWWFDKRAWAFMAVFALLMGWSHSYHGPQRVAPRKVVFYSTSWCPYSQALRDYLTLGHIPFEERNIEASADNFIRWWWAAGKRGGFPIVQVGPTVVSKGFYLRDIESALRAAGYQPPEVVQVTEGFSEPR